MRADWNIGGKRLVMSGTEEMLSSYRSLFRGFETQEQEIKPSFEITVKQVKHLVIPESMLTITPFCFAEDLWGKHLVWHQYYPNALLLASKQWTSAMIYEGMDALPKEEQQLCRENLMLNLYTSGNARDGGLFLHGALVDYEGQGILFTGSSGAGKSTQADLWARHLGAEIINGDKVILRREKSGWVGYGSPWAGSSRYIKNKKVMVKTIISLQKAAENRMEQLDGIDVMEAVASHLYYPSWDRNALSKTMGEFQNLAEEIPMYRLFCRPDEMAVQVARQAVYG